MNVCRLLWLLTGYVVLGIWCKDAYLITTPNSLISEADHTFSVYVSTNVALVIETVLLNSQIKNRTNVIILKTGFQSIKYYVPFIGLHLGLALQLRFLGDKCPSEKICQTITNVNGTFIMENRELDIILDNFIILSETDKPIYKPGEVIKLRAMALYPTNLMSEPSYNGPQIEIVYVNDKYGSVPSLRSQTSSFDLITIETPDNVKMAQWLNVSFDDAMKLDFRLSNDPMFGQWKISIVLGTQTEITTFSVKKYVLPRFVVDLNPPSIILQSDKNINFSVCAKYSTGKNMQALIQGELCIRTNKHTCRPFTSSLNGSSKCSEISISGSPFGLGSKDIIYYSMPSSVSVTVTENGTSHKIKKMAEGSNIKYISYEIAFLSKPYFKPGLPYFGKLMLLRHDGTPQQNSSIIISVENNFNYDWGFEQSYTSNKEGIIDFVIPYIPIKVTINLNIHGVEDKLNNVMSKPTKYQNLVNWESQDNEYIQISSLQNDIKCPGIIPMTLLTNGDISSIVIYTQIFSRGVIKKIIEYQSVPVKCTSRNDDLGHYECTDKNQLKCLSGWKGGNCREPICKEGCVKGICLSQDRCVCKVGWTGKLCDKCIMAKYCVNGYCRNGNDCECLPGWIGFRCETKGPKTHYYKKTVTPLITTPKPKPEPVYQNQTIFERYIEIPIEKDMGPDLHIVVFYINSGNEVIADSIEINKGLTECSHLGGGKFQFDEENANPGETVKLSLDPGTRKKSCALRISDVVLSQFGQSSNINLEYLIRKLVLLNHKITKKTDYGDNCRKTMPGLWLGDNNGYDSKISFIQSGLTPITNLRVVNTICKAQMETFKYYYLSYSLDSNIDRKAPNMEVPAPEKQIPKQKEKLKEEVDKIKKQIREYFPETWIFDYYNVTPAQINLTVPDSMTTWKANSYCMTERGIWIAPSRYLTVTLPFFADIYVLYSIKMGEQLQLPVKVFNYIDDCYEIKTVINVNASEITISGPISFTLCVCANDIKTIYFSIKAKIIGKLNITITSKSQYSPYCSNGTKQNKKVNLSDSIRRQLLVEPSGIPSETTFSALICCKNESIGLKGPVNIPSDVVIGSLRSYLVYNGDVMGQTLDNLDKLVKMPYGCGEQNMVALVPSIYVLDYLTNLKINNPKLVNKAKGYIVDGYQRQLAYKHPDGSYSAFGKNDKQGNTWLTAFVLRSFLDASKYVSIDKNILNESTKYLKKMQLSNGCFKEQGKLLSSTMAGGLKNKGETDSALLTAYVLISIKSVKIYNNYFDIDKALTCLKSGLNAAPSLYRLALSGYALSIHDPQSTITKSVLDQLQNSSTSSGRYKYWKSGLDSPGLYTQINSADIETTGYALLALQNSQTLEESLRTVYWLSNQRNSLGGFCSTQDTIVALNSIAVIAEKIGATSFQKINLEVILDDNIRHNDSLSISNRFVTRKVNVGSQNITYISILANGSGCVSFQLISLYNIHKLFSSKEEFKIEVMTSLTDVMKCTTLEVKLCSSYLRKDRNSNMILITIDFPSGWQLSTVERNEILKQLMNPLKRIDFMENKMDLYYDAFSYADESNERCFTFRLHQTSKVDNLKSSLIRIVDYYKPEIYTDIFYSVPNKTCRKVNTTKPKPPKAILCPQCINDTSESVYLFQSSICPWSFSGFVKASNKTLKNRLFYEAKERLFYEWTVDLEPSSCTCVHSWGHIYEDFIAISSDWLSLDERLTFTNTSFLFPRNVVYRAYSSDLRNSCSSADSLYRMMTRVDPNITNLTAVNKTCSPCILFSNLYHSVANMSTLICSKHPRWSLTITLMNESKIIGTMSKDRNVTIFVEATFPLSVCFCLQKLKNLKMNFEVIDTENKISTNKNTAAKPLSLVFDDKFKIVESGIFAQYNWTKC